MRLVAAVARIGAVTRIGVVALVAGLGWAMAGCGGDRVAPLAGIDGGGLVLVDTVTAAHFSVSVAGGALTLAGMGNSGTASPEVALTDGVTGRRYSLVVTNGALTLVGGSHAELATSQIGLTDTVMAKTYVLAVVGGALTLIPS